jgi:hypothetical protein
VPNNNPVERWFGYLKNNIVKKRNNLISSEFIGPLKSRLKSLFYDYFSENESEPSFKTTSGEKVENSKPKFKIMRERGYYLKNKELFKELDLQENSEQDGEFLTTFLIDNFSINLHGMNTSESNGIFNFLISIF